jgi:uncharacterized coiled-coil protein SlyX
VTYQYDHTDIDDEIPEDSETKRRVPLVIIVAGLAILGVVSAFAWRNYGGSPYPSFAFANSSAGTSEAKTVGIDEFRAVQQQLVGQMQSNTQALAAQQAEVKRLSDQLAAVSGKMDAIQSSIASARTAISTTASPIRPQPTKQSPKPKPSARISTGGAPLPPPMQLTR